jgi:hypothetical protein
MPEELNNCFLIGWQFVKQLKCKKIRQWVSIFWTEECVATPLAITEISNSLLFSIHRLEYSFSW